MGVDQYFQRYRIVTKKLTGPTGDPFFSYEYQYIGQVQSEAEGDAMQAIYQQYSKSGFVVDLEAEADDIRASKPAPHGPVDDGGDLAVDLRIPPKHPDVRQD